MPWFISVAILFALFLYWGLIMAGTVALLQFVGIPYVLALPVACVSPLLVIFIILVVSDYLLTTDKRIYPE